MLLFGKNQGGRNSSKTAKNGNKQRDRNFSKIAKGGNHQNGKSFSKSVNSGKSGKKNGAGNRRKGSR